MTKRLSLKGFTVAVLMSVGITLWGHSAYLWGKAALAQHLIHQAWLKNINSSNAFIPWPWADTWPVAKLQLESEQLMVLAGATGRVLAFGPGWLMSTAVPGKVGNTVILGHRDTHFSVLNGMALGDPITLELHSGRTRYRVTHTEVVHMQDTRYLGETDQQTLTLVTCYPFEQLDPATPWRFVVRAEVVSRSRVNYKKEHTFL